MYLTPTKANALAVHCDSKIFSAGKSPAKKLVNMCNHQLEIYNNSHFLSPYHYHAVKMRVPCGHCVECDNRRVLEWNGRSYYEAKRCLKSGGFIVFDTLTYRESAIPRFQDIDSRFFRTAFGHTYCFNSHDVQNFLKRLRKILSHRYGDISGKFRYLVTSEYGEKEGATHRSHYHCLFYVNLPIDPVVFSRLVSSCWKLGRTDGVKYKGILYFKYKRLFIQLNPSALEQIYYVTKYVSKGSLYERVYRRKLYLAYCALHGFDWQVSYSHRLEFAHLLRAVGCFHLQSLRYGGNLVDEIGEKDIIERGCVTIPVHGKYISVPISNSIVRSILQETFVFKGRKMWRYKAGVEELLGYKFDKICNGLVEKYRNFVFQQHGEIRKYLDTFLLELRDIAEYSVGLRNRFVGIDQEPKYCYLQSKLALDLPRMCEDGDIIYNYSTAKDRHRFGAAVYSDQWLPSHDRLFHHRVKIADKKKLRHNVFKSNHFTWTHRLKCRLTPNENLLLRCFKNEEFEYFLDLYDKYLSLKYDQEMAKSLSLKYVKKDLENAGMC